MSGERKLPRGAAHAVLAALCVAGCAGEDLVPIGDADAGRPDAGAAERDGGAILEDAGDEEPELPEPEDRIDAGSGTPDAAVTDAGAPDPVDAGAPSPDAGTPPMPANAPGGWTTSSLVFAQGRMKLDGADNDWVALGWIELDSTATEPACGGSGPRAKRVFHRWSHSDYPAGDCNQDRKSGVDFRRWDESSVRLDDCPGREGFVESGAPARRPFLYDCPAHVPAGFGEAAARRELKGHYQYDAARRTLVFRYDVNGDCRKEYYRDLTLDPAGKLLSMRLDGAVTADTTAAARGLGVTHGYAYASSAPVTRAVPFDTAMAALASRSFLADAWRFREARNQTPPQPEHYQLETPLGMRPQYCRANAYYHHSCGRADGAEPPYLAQCAGKSPAQTAYLRFFVDPFPGRDSRENLFWAWHAAHTPNWTGCYHRGSHSNPLLQVVDSDGVFRGYVGIEIQRSARVVGGVADPNGHLQTDYRVQRWIEDGYREKVGP